ncbi:MAG TPA: hypothetical protein DEB39_15135 [Planctomycetaceae bacterium]|nr:hypothetical protein [Planctomycetaceae bacterium]
MNISPVDGVKSLRKFREKPVKQLHCASPGARIRNDDRADHVLKAIEVPRSRRIRSLPTGNNTAVGKQAV